MTLAELDVVIDADGRMGTIILLPGIEGGVLVEYQLAEHVWESHWRDPATLRKVGDIPPSEADR